MVSKFASGTWILHDSSPGTVKVASLPWLAFLLSVCTLQLAQLLGQPLALLGLLEQLQALAALTAVELSAAVH